MKDYYAPSGSKLILESRETRDAVDLYSRDGLNMLSNLWIKVAAEHRLMYEPTWLGRPIIQFTNDIVVIQEILWRLKPDLVIETGIAHGGSLILSASILELIGKGRVLGIDIEIRPHNLQAIQEHPLSRRITMIEGSSVADDTIARVRAELRDAKTVLVILDSNHTEAHVLKELTLYAPFVTPGSYIIAHDGAQAWVSETPRGKPEWKDDSPLQAIHKFVRTHPEFSIDQSCNRLGITSSPDGFLKRAGSAG